MNGAALICQNCAILCTDLLGTFALHNCDGRNSVCEDCVTSALATASPSLGIIAQVAATDCRAAGSVAGLTFDISCPTSTGTGFENSNSQLLPIQPTLSVISTSITGGKIGTSLTAAPSATNMSVGTGIHFITLH